jgi:hypothetical protein
MAKDKEKEGGSSMAGVSFLGGEAHDTPRPPSGRAAASASPPPSPTVTVLFDPQQHARDVEVPPDVPRSRPGALQVIPGRSVVLTRQEMSVLAGKGVKFRVIDPEAERRMTARRA